MISNCLKKWIVTMYFFIPTANLQFPYAMPAPVYPFPPPPPPPMPIALPVPIPIMLSSNFRDRSAAKTTTTTTTTTESSRNMLEQIPLPVHISIFPQSPPRFMNPPFPAPFPAPAPAFPIPGPPLLVVNRPKRKGTAKCSSEETASDSYESDCDHGKKRRKRKRKIGHSLKRPKGRYRKMVFGREIDDNELVKPVLTYVAKNGDVKLRKKLSADEAAALIDEGPYQRVRVTTFDAKNRSGLSVLSNSENLNFIKHKKRQVILRSGNSKHSLGEGKKELIFNPPANSKISNLSVSFQISPV